MIEIEIKTLELQQNISRAAQGLEQRGSLMRLIAGRLHQAVDENFNSQGRPAWAGLKLGSQLSRAGALTKRGQVSQARLSRGAGLTVVCRACRWLPIPRRCISIP